MSWADCDFSGGGQVGVAHGACIKSVGHLEPHQDCCGRTWVIKGEKMDEKRALLEKALKFRDRLLELTGEGSWTDDRVVQFAASKVAEATRELRDNYNTLTECWRQEQKERKATESALAQERARVRELEDKVKRIEAYSSQLLKDHNRYI